MSVAFSVTTFTPPLHTQTVDFNQMEHMIQLFATESSIRAVLERGVELQHYSREIKSDLETAESTSIDDCIRQAPRVSQLKQDIQTCDQTLDTMSALLRQFKISLGQLSSDISVLQTLCQAITLRRQNRKGLEQHFEEFTRQLSIPSYFDNLSNTEIGPSYIPLLAELSEKLNYISRKEIRHSLAAQEVSLAFDQLRIRAADNIRLWIIARINDFKLGESGRLSMQNRMLRCKTFIQFLKTHAPDVHQISIKLYIDVVSRVYVEKYQRATARVIHKMSQVSMAIEMIVPPKNSIIKYGNMFFSLGERARFLKDTFGPPPRFKGDSYPLELLIRGLYQSLIDHVTSGYAFASEFFDDDDLALEIFAPTTHHLEHFLEDLIGKIVDPICIALLLRFISASKSEMERRYIFKIDQHLTNLQKLFTERFHAIIGLNREVMETADPRVFIENEETAYHANAMTQRFVEFAKSMSLLMNDEVAEVIVLELHMIAASVIDLLEKISRGFSGPGLSNAFLINNYYFVVSVLKPINECLIVGHFELKLADCSEEYIEIELEIAFEKLVKIVSHAFIKMEFHEEPPLTGIDESELKDIAIDFKTSHIEKIRQISELQRIRFGDFMNGKRIFGLLAKRLVLYWTKFEQLCRGVVSQPQWFGSLISAQQLVDDLRPFTDAIF
jgi:hypothetical protein